MPSNQTTLAWAKTHLSAVCDTSRDSLAAWCDHLKENPAEVTSLDWLAFQVINNGTSNWQTAVKLELPGVAMAQWQQLHRYKDDFFSLTTSQKRARYEELKEYLDNNPLALLMLERYRPFLDLSPAPADLSADAAQLLESLATISIFPPRTRPCAVASLFHTASQDPVRWKHAALELLAHPQYVHIEPSIATSLADQRTTEGPSEKDRRRRLAKFRSRFKWQVLGYKAKGALPVLTVMALMSFGALIGFLTSEKQRQLKAPVQRPPNEQELIGSIPPELREDVRRLLLEARQPPATGQQSFLPDGSSPKALFRVIAWSMAAESEGSAGLERIRSEMQRQLELVTKLEKPDAIVAQTNAIEAFDQWRKEAGDAIARQRDEAKEP